MFESSKEVPRQFYRWRQKEQKLGPKPELFYEFDVELELDGKIIEIECNPNSLELMDYEEEVDISDKRFSEMP